MSVIASTSVRPVENASLISPATTRKEDIEAASAHDFPSFSEVHPEEMKGFIKGQQDHGAPHGEKPGSTVNACVCEVANHHGCYGSCRLMFHSYPYVMSCQFTDRLIDD